MTFSRKMGPEVMDFDALPQSDILCQQGVSLKTRYYSCNRSQTDSDDLFLLLGGDIMEWQILKYL